MNTHEQANPAGPMTPQEHAFIEAAKNATPAQLSAVMMYFHITQELKKGGNAEAQRLKAEFDAELSSGSLKGEKAVLTRLTEIEKAIAANSAEAV